MYLNVFAEIILAMMCLTPISVLSLQFIMNAGSLNCRALRSVSGVRKYLNLSYDVTFIQ